jgi:hypothetical protein
MSYSMTGADAAGIVGGLASIATTAIQIVGAKRAQQAQFDAFYANQEQQAAMMAEEARQTLAMMRARTPLLAVLGIGLFAAGIAWVAWSGDES